MSYKPLVVIIGPTAAGKTAVSVQCAQALDGEIVSGDSMQVYRGMDIGTAKITPHEKQNIPHHMIDIINPNEEFSVADFQQRAQSCIDNILTRGKLPILVGGTGLYIQAIVDNLDFTEIEIDWDFRNHLKVLAREKGNAYLHQQLKNVDPQAALKIHPNDLRRMIRALEVFEKTGKPISEFQKASKQIPSPYSPIMIGISMEREVLYDRINERVEKMFEMGLEEEVKKMLRKGYDSSLIAMQGLGYKEVIPYLQGQYDLEEVKRVLKRDTRHFAKRQLTWFKRDERITWFNGLENHVADQIILHIKEQLI